MNTTTKSSDSLRQFFWLAIILLAGAEIMAVSFLADARTVTISGSASYFISYAGDILKWMILSAAIFALFISKNLSQIDEKLAEGTEISRYYWAIPLHAFCFALFLWSTLSVFGSTAAAGNIQFSIWIALTLSTAVTFALVISSPTNLLSFVSEYKKPLVISILGGLALLLTSLGARLLWEPLSNLTMHSSYAILNLFYDSLLIDVEAKLLGVNDFVVRIAPECSGVEGMALALGVTSAYLYFSKNHLSFPQAFLLLPIAAVLALLFNFVRVAALIAIGASISPEIAVEGFHSVAGWISSVLIAMLIIFVFSSWTKLQSTSGEVYEPTTEDIRESGLATAILIPFIFFMAASLVAGIFKEDFDYLYPIKLVVAFVALLFFLSKYELRIPKNWIEPIGIGFCVALLWVVLIPADVEANDTFQSHLFALPVWLIAIWGIARVLGFWIFAPIVEELVFRCYLMNRIGGISLRTHGRVEFSVIAFVITSLLFGLLHADWIAGAVAGALFAVARYRSDTMSSPIVAHATANILVGIWAVMTQNWILL